MNLQPELFFTFSGPIANPLLSKRKALNMLQSYKPGGGGGVGGSSGSIQMKLGGVKLNSRHHQTFTAAGHDDDDDSTTAGSFRKVTPQELSSTSAIESRSDICTYFHPSKVSYRSKKPEMNWGIT